ncbi:MAG TPA: AI-2E family transporter [Mycobacteriales bacterium]|jgi:predicted PurR-regulated permease PerM|nr:AI-2E family transporter [Mycobacteriales bacterium]
MDQSDRRMLEPTDVLEEATEQAERAGKQADRAEDAAEHAGQEADLAQGAAVKAESAAIGLAEELPAIAEQLHEEAEALLAAAAVDDLASGEVRERVAGVDEQNPFGKPGRPLSETSPLRLGFALTLGGLLALTLGAAVLAVRQVLVLVVISAFLAIGLDPAVTWLERWMRRTLAVTVVMLGFLGLFGGFMAAALPPLSRQVGQLIARGPKYVDDLARNRTIHTLDMKFHFLGAARAQAARLPKEGINAFGGILGASAAVVGVLISVITVVTLTLYLLANMPGLKRFCYRLVPRTRRARVSLLSDEILARVGGYVLGNLATSVIAGVAVLVFLLITGVPYAVALALLVALADLIPLIGATIGAAIVVIVAFLGADLNVGVASIVFFAIYQQFENYLLAPRVMKRTVDVSPLVTVLAALLGGALLGIVGALLAIPVAAAIQLILREVFLPRQEEA